MKKILSIVVGLGLVFGALAAPVAAQPAPVPDYFGIYPNYANSPIIQKFMDSLPGLNTPNNLGQQIPVAVPASYLGADYYEIAVVEYSEKMHSQLPATRLRGYRQLNAPSGHPAGSPHYLGPMIIAQKDRPVRIKFTNMLPTGTGGNLFIPVDTSLMGAGEGPLTSLGAECNPTVETCASYTQNRASLHLHGGATPWISDGTPHQWTVPAGESTPYKKGLSTVNVPDMPNPGDGSMTLYYTNEQSARLMFYHDHVYGLTRLNVYAGGAAGYLVQDPVEQGLVSSGVIPADQIPLIIQDKTFVDAANIAAQDPTWIWGTTPPTPHTGDLWFPHVYMPNQWPDSPELSGAAPMGRWDYGPWFWPPLTAAAGLVHPEVPCLYTPGSMCPGTPNPSAVPEGFMDTPVVNGTAYPFVQVAPKAYRLRILNASNDRSINLSLFYAANNVGSQCKGNAVPSPSCTEVAMVPAVPHTAATNPKLCTTATDAGPTGLGLAVGDLSFGPSGLPPTCWPTTWPTDGRDGGVPDPLSAGPAMIQIGTEGGLIPSPVVIPPTPIGYEYNRRSITVLNVGPHGLTLGPAERADVIVDFSSVPPGSTLMLYNDSGAPVPAFDPRNDYYTGDPDHSLTGDGTGGAPTTLPGYGPNIRTIMQIRVAGTASAPYNFNALQTALPGAFAQSQPLPIVPEIAYDAAVDSGQPYVTGTTLGTLRNNFPGYTGMKIVVGSQPILVGALGRMMAPGNSGTHTLKLVRASDHTDVPGGAASISMLGGAVGQFKYGNLSSTVTLAANTAYYLVSYETIGGDTWYDANTAVTTTTAAAASPVYQYPPNTGAWYEIAGMPGHAYVPLDMKTVFPSTYVTGTTLGTLRNNFPGYTGMKIAVGARPMVLTGLGRMMAPGNTGTHTLKLVRASTHTDVPGGSVSVSMLGGTAGQFKYGNLSNPVTLLANTAYYLVSYETAGGDRWYDSNTAVTTTTEAAASPVYQYPPNVGAWYEISGMPGHAYVPLDMQTTYPNTYSSIQATSLTFTPYGSPTQTTVQMLPKAIQELFELNYGRMNATLGVELPFTNFNTQTTIPLGYTDPVTETMSNNETQLWKITHNGVDTHAIHVHLFNVQVINRVGWDGAIKPPDPNELGWKETVRMNPLEDVIVALRPVAPTLPFAVPNSWRPLNVTMPVNAPITVTDPTTGNPITIFNTMTYFGWEYVWHCHLLGHEENDMMRPIIFQVP